MPIVVKNDPIALLAGLAQGAGQFRTAQTQADLLGNLRNEQFQHTQFDTQQRRLDQQRQDQLAAQAFNQDFQNRSLQQRENLANDQITRDYYQQQDNRAYEQQQYDRRAQDQQQNEAEKFAQDQIRQQQDYQNRLSLQNDAQEAVGQQLQQRGLNSQNVAQIKTGAGAVGQTRFLSELDQQLADGLISPADHAAIKLRYMAGSKNLGGQTMPQVTERGADALNNKETLADYTFGQDLQKLDQQLAAKKQQADQVHQLALSRLTNAQEATKAMQRKQKFDADLSQLHAELMAINSQKDRYDPLSQNKLAPQIQDVQRRIEALALEGTDAGVPMDMSATGDLSDWETGGTSPTSQPTTRPATQPTGPVQINSIEEYRLLPSGASYVDPHGVMRVKR